MQPFRLGTLFSLALPVLHSLKLTTITVIFMDSLKDRPLLVFLMALEDSYQAKVLSMSVSCTETMRAHSMPLDKVSSSKTTSSVKWDGSSKAIRSKSEWLMSWRPGTSTSSGIMVLLEMVLTLIINMKELCTITMTILIALMMSIMRMMTTTKTITMTPMTPLTTSPPRIQPTKLILMTLVKFE